ncbi:hypothetical protein [Bremerella volcania]|nr:hypothetical protein [Bremerella volcania]
MNSDHPDDFQTPEPAPLRPSWLLVALSILNIAAGAVTASIALVGLELLWPNPIGYSLLLILLIGLVTMVGQYFGTFRGSYHAAFLAAGASGGCYSMSYLAIVIHRIISDLNSPATAGSGLSHQQSVVWPAIFVVTMGSLWLNGRWGWQLKRRNDQTAGPTRLSISLREMFAFCFLLGLIILPASIQAHRNQSIYRANVAAADAPFPVPDQAEAIQYQRDRHGLIIGSYEVDEQELRSWLDVQAFKMSTGGARLQEITAGPILVTPPDPTQTPFLVPYGTHRVTKGLRAYWHVDDLYHMLTYDRATGVAYYQELAIPE